MDSLYEKKLLILEESVCNQRLHSTSNSLFKYYYNTEEAKISYTKLLQVCNNSSNKTNTAKSIFQVKFNNRNIKCIQHLTRYSIHNNYSTSKYYILKMARARNSLFICKILININRTYLRTEVHFYWLTETSSCKNCIKVKTFAAVICLVRNLKSLPENSKTIKTQRKLHLQDEIIYAHK